MDSVPNKFQKNESGSRKAVSARKKAAGFLID